jgi:hypothetical protein
MPLEISRGLLLLQNCPMRMEVWLTLEPSQTTPDFRHCHKKCLIAGRECRKRVFESIMSHEGEASRRIMQPEELAHTRKPSEIVKLFLIRGWTIGDDIGQRTQDWTTSSFVNTEDVRTRCCWGRRAISVGRKERTCVVNY